MKAISLFSGVGGFDLGFERAGIETVLQAERDPHCLKVLERHWPQTERVTDVRCVGIRRPESGIEPRALSLVAGGRWDALGCDLVYGGFPCQDLSVAGKRAGLGGERSGLWYEFHRVLSELRPRWAVIENVPGLLSSNEGRDYGIILDGLGELGYGVGWAVLDAQHFGVPQRRRRVFIVGCLGDQRSAQQVLSVCESCGGNPETGRTQGERVARDVEAGAGVAGWDAEPVAFHWQANTDDVSLAQVPGSLSTQRVQAVMTFEARFARNGRGAPSDIAPSLKAENGQTGKGDGAPLVYAIQDGRDGTGAQAIAAPLGSNATGGFDLDHDTYIPTIVGALSDGAHHGGGLNGQDAHTGRVIATSGVRRLTPLECQRLQGFPDWWYDGLDLADSHIYRQMGNAVCVPVAEWIGHRIKTLEAIR